MSVPYNTHPSHKIDISDIIDLITHDRDIYPCWKQAEALIEKIDSIPTLEELLKFRAMTLADIKKFIQEAWEKFLKLFDFGTLSGDELTKYKKNKEKFLKDKEKEFKSALEGKIKKIRSLADEDYFKAIKEAYQDLIAYIENWINPIIAKIKEKLALLKYLIQPPTTLADVIRFCIEISMYNYRPFINNVKTGIYTLEVAACVYSAVADKLIQLSKIPNINLSLAPLDELRKSTYEIKEKISPELMKLLKSEDPDKSLMEKMNELQKEQISIIPDFSWIQAPEIEGIEEFQKMINPNEVKKVGIDPPDFTETLKALKEAFDVAKDNAAGVMKVAEKSKNRIKKFNDANVRLIQSITNLLGISNTLKSLSDQVATQQLSGLDKIADPSAVISSANLIDQNANNNTDDEDDNFDDEDDLPHNLDDEIEDNNDDEENNTDGEDDNTDDEIEDNNEQLNSDEDNTDGLGI